MGTRSVFFGCFIVLVIASFALAANSGRSRHVNSPRQRDKGDWGSCKCNNATHCVQMMTEESFSKQATIVSSFPKNYKKAVQIAKQRDREMEATLSRMMVRFFAVFQQNYTQQVEQVQAILRRLERLKEKQEFDNPQKFMGLAKGVSKALMRTHAMFNDFVAQIVSEYSLINTNVLQLQ